QVVPKNMSWNKLKYADVIFLSYEDIDGLDDALEELCLLGNIIVVTDGDKGADVFINGNKQHFPAVPSKLVDPTGAGDIFATAFIIRYLQHNDLSDAMIHAHLAASEHIAKTR
ncbi:MAG: carbohydrate kinase family protein, partial [Bacteroidia bacterium]|nr:carbohydrate kinase family protein [Bacteroidia bacterium]